MRDWEETEKEIEGIPDISNQKVGDSINCLSNKLQFFPGCIKLGKGFKTFKEIPPLMAKED